MQDAFLVGKDRNGRGIDAKCDVGLSGGGVGHVGGPAQQIGGLDRLPVEREFPSFHVVKIQNVIDQTHQPVAVADGHLNHFVLLFRTFVERAGGE